jgi:hypothetical protein
MENETDCLNEKISQLYNISTLFLSILDFKTRQRELKKNGTMARLVTTYKNNRKFYSKGKIDRNDKSHGMFCSLS